MKKIAMFLLFCVICLTGYTQSLGHAKKTNNIFEYINNGVWQRIYINGEGKYIGKVLKAYDGESKGVAMISFVKRVFEAYIEAIEKNKLVRVNTMGYRID